MQNHSALKNLLKQKYPSYLNDSIDYYVEVSRDLSEEGFLSYLRGTKPLLLLKLNYPDRKEDIEKIPKALSHIYSTAETCLLEMNHCEGRSRKQKEDEAEVDLFAEEDDSKAKTKNVFDIAIEIRRQERKDTKKEKELYEEMVLDELYERVVEKLNQNRKAKKHKKEFVDQKIIDVIYLPKNSMGWSIPQHINACRDLKWLDKLLLRQIELLDTHNRTDLPKPQRMYCTCNNSRFSLQFCVSPMTINRSIERLLEKEYIGNHGTKKKPKYEFLLDPNTRNAGRNVTDIFVNEKIILIDNLSIQEKIFMGMIAVRQKHKFPHFKAEYSSSTYNDDFIYWDTYVQSIFDIKKTRIKKIFAKLQSYNYITRTSPENKPRKFTINKNNALSIKEHQIKTVLSDIKGLNDYLNK